MEDLEAIRQRRLRELQEQQARSGSQDGSDGAEVQDADQDAAIDRVLQQILEPEARERLTRIRMSRPELAEAVTRQLVTAIQQGGLAKRITDAQMRELLARFAPRGRDINITRK